MPVARMPMRGTETSEIVERTQGIGANSRFEPLGIITR
jgi:hypothetical protein